MKSEVTDEGAGAVGPGGFARTRWTLVLRAQGDSAEARVALGDLCEAYYRPVLAFVRREVGDEDLARELTQAFFAEVLRRGGVGRPDPARGRFRSYLLGAVRHFLADHRKREGRLKRGGGMEHEPWGDDGTDPGSPQEAAGTGGGEEVVFDRAWALTVMERALGMLEREFEAGGRGDQFRCLKPWLAGDAEAASREWAAVKLGISESAMKVAIHRLRKRFREMVRGEVAQTLAEGDSVQEELRYLVEVLVAADRAG